MNFTFVLIECLVQLSFNLIKFAPCAQVSQLAPRIIFIVLILSRIPTCATLLLIKTISKSFLALGYIYIYILSYFSPCASSRQRKETMFFLFCFCFSSVTSLLAPLLLFLFLFFIFFLLALSLPCARKSLQLFVFLFFSPPCATIAACIYTQCTSPNHLSPFSNFSQEQPSFFYSKSTRNSALFRN